MPLFGGIFIDKFGVHFWIILFSLFTIIGQAIFTISGYLADSYSFNNGSFSIAIIGRMIFGLGGEYLGIWQSTIICKWFNGKELSFALGVVLSVSWFGNTLTNYFIPTLAADISLGFSLAAGLMICLLSFIFALLLILFDKNADEFDYKNGIRTKDFRQTFKFRHIFELKLPFWVLMASCMFINIGLLFYIISNEFLSIRYGFDQIDSGILLSKVYFVSIFIGPIFGYLSDKIGYRVTFTIISTSIISLWCFMLMIIPSSSEDNKTYIGMIPLFLMKIWSSIFISVAYPIVSYVVSPQVNGSAYGVFSSLINTTYAFGPFIIVYLTFPEYREGTYFWVCFSLGFISLLGTFCSYYLLIIDRSVLNNILQMPSKFSDSDENEFQIPYVETVKFEGGINALDPWVKTK